MSEFGDHLPASTVIYALAALCGFLYVLLSANVARAQTRIDMAVRTTLSPGLFMIPAGYESLTGRDLQDLTGRGGQRPAASADDEQP